MIYEDALYKKIQIITHIFPRHEWSVQYMHRTGVFIVFMWINWLRWFELCQLECSLFAQFAPNVSSDGSTMYLVGSNKKLEEDYDLYLNLLVINFLLVEQLDFRYVGFRRAFPTNFKQFSLVIIFQFNDFWRLFRSKNIFVARWYWNTFCLLRKYLVDN